MQNKEAIQLPFLNRDMLNFEHGAVLSLQIKTQASSQIAITIRGITREGVFNFNHKTTGNYLPTTSEFRIPDIPIFVSVLDQYEAFKQGECIVTLNLLLNGDIIYTLCSGFVYAQKSISYPPSPTIDLIPNRGVFKTISSNDPAAGDEIMFEVPAGRILHLIAAGFRLITDATVANRRVHFIIGTSGGLNIHIFPSIDQVASLTRDYNLMQTGAITDEADGINIIIPMPQNIYLGEDDTLSTETSDLQAGDNFSTMKLLIEEFFAVPI